MKWFTSTQSSLAKWCLFVQDGHYFISSSKASFQGDEKWFLHFVHSKGLRYQDFWICSESLKCRMLEIESNDDSQQLQESKYLPSAEVQQAVWLQEHQDYVLQFNHEEIENFADSLRLQNISHLLPFPLLLHLCIQGQNFQDTKLFYWEGATCCWCLFYEDGFLKAIYQVADSGKLEKLKNIFLPSRFQLVNPPDMLNFKEWYPEETNPAQWMNSFREEKQETPFVYQKGQSHNASQKQFLFGINKLSQFAKHSVLTMFVGLSILFSVGGAWYFSQRQEYQSFEKELLSIESIRQEQQKLSIQKKSLIELLGQKTASAEVLQKISKTLVKNVWLEELMYNEEKFQVKGFAFQEEDLADFLLKLEGEFKFVRLKSTELLSKRKVYQLSRVASNRRELVAFRLEVK